MSTVIPQIIPPHADHGWQPAKFDHHQFGGKRSKAVSADTGISFGDFKSMHVYRTVVQQKRKLATPEWPFNDEQMKDVVLTFLERRLYIKRANSTDPGKTYEERMAAIKEAELEHLAHDQKTLDNLLKRYNQDKLFSESAAYLKGLETEIQNADSRIVMMKRGLTAIAFAVVHYYYKLGWNSVQIANEVGIKSPMVRIWLYRMNHQVTGKRDRSRSHATHYCKIIGAHWPKKRIQYLFTLLLQGKNESECANIMGTSQSVISAVWKNNFGNLNRNFRRNSKIDRSLLLEMRFAFKMKLRECAEYFDVTTQTICNRLHRSK